MGKSKIELIREYKKLLDEGAITPEEFVELKKDLLFNHKIGLMKKNNSSEVEENDEENNTLEKNGNKNDNKDPSSKVEDDISKKITPIKITDSSSSTLTCEKCGSSDSTKIDDYTYKCNYCGAIINLKRPDINIQNFNSFTSGNVNDATIFKIKKTIDEKTFIRKVVLYLILKDDISPLFLENFIINEEMVELAYITFADVECSVDVSYSCKIGTDYEVKYLDSNGNEKTKKETRWEPFSGNGNDGGVRMVCTFGSETITNFLIPSFNPNKNTEYEEYTPEKIYPLKKNLDKSTQVHLKMKFISSLEYDLQSHLPGDHYESWKANGRCNIIGINSYYYVPCYNVETKVLDRSIIITSTANDESSISHSFLKDEETSFIREESAPTDNDAKIIYKASKLGKSIKIFNILLIILLITFIILFSIFGVKKGSTAIALFVVGLLSCIICFIINGRIKSKTIWDIYFNLRYDFEHKKLNAGIKCLGKNNLVPLSIEEKKHFCYTTKKYINEGKSLVVSSIFSCLAILFSILSILFSVSNFGNGPSTTFSVTFNSFGGSAIPSQTVNYGGKATRPSNPSKDGYTFENWCKDNSLTNIYDFSTPVITNLTLYAKWNINSCTVTFNTNGGSAIPSQTVNYGEKVTRPSNPSKDRYTFINWYKDNSLTNIYDFSTPVIANLTLYAKWNINQYPVNVYTNDENKGTVKGGGTFDYGSEVTVTATPIGDFVFNGWYSDSGHNHLLSKKNEYLITVPSGGISLYAKFWTKAEEWDAKHGVIPVISEDGKTLTYGLYPQTHVNDSSLIAELEKIAPETNEEYFFYNNEYYVKDTGNPLDSDYTFADGTKVVNGTTYYFKCEPITWNIVSSGDNYIIDCFNILYAHSFDAGSNIYKDSELRTWLNGDFYNKAFSIKTTSSYIVPTDLSDVSVTGDKVWAGSKSQYDGDWYSSNSARQKKVSDFAICNFAYMYTSHNGFYWTRSPHSDYSYLAWCVDCDGRLRDVNVTDSGNGCSPALTIKI